MTAPVSPWIQTGTGRALDLMAPTAASIDLEHDVAEALAREPRFGGHVRSGSYSVAQHCVLGTDAIIAETGSLELARAFLLHDAHEAYCKDIMTPLALALEKRTRAAIISRMRLICLEVPEGAMRLVADGAFKEALAGLKRDLDAAIHAAAGMRWPLAPEIAAKVAEWDLAMLAVERRHLLAPAPKSWGPVIEAAQPARLKGRITVWPWAKAADEWRGRLHTLFPHLAAKRAA